MGGDDFHDPAVGNAGLDVDPEPSPSVPRMDTAVLDLQSLPSV